MYSSPEAKHCLVVLLTNPKKTNKKVSRETSNPTGIITKKNNKNAMR